MPQAAAIRDMFAGVAPRYDLLNRVLSAGVDIAWRKAAVRYAQVRPGDRALDCCSGTGDLAFDVARAGATVLGADFCPPMLLRAARKRSRRGVAGQRAGFVAGDTLRLPVRDARFDLVTIAFGLRNLEDPLAGLREMARVLRPGGRIVILEFARPRVPVLGSLFRFYFRRVLPRIGRWISPGSGSAYTYLPESVQEFPDREQVTAMLRATGFQDAEYRLLTAGVAALYRGVRG
jgi:demethylmenaquinone methyltransferase/2-methoxy-6-polyprenyl-1,4-benzoquinol methylase